MDCNFDNWEVEVQSTRRSNASILELDFLSHLTILNIHILNATILPISCFEKLVRYEISIGDLLLVCDVFYEALKNWDSSLIIALNWLMGSKHYWRAVNILILVSSQNVNTRFSPLSLQVCNKQPNQTVHERFNVILIFWLNIFYWYWITYRILA